MKRGGRERAMFHSDMKPENPSVTDSQPGEGRRHGRRAYGGVVVRLTPHPKECGALDLSSGGVGLLSSERLELGQVVHLAFMGRTVSVRGVVSHVRPMASGDWRIGISFLRDEPELAEVALAVS